MMSRLAAVFTLALLTSMGCATAPPVSSTIADVDAAPQDYRNVLVEIHGRVVRYREPKGDLARTWNFSIQNKDGQVLRVFTDRRSPDDIAAADQLIARAADEGGLVFVSGYVRVGEYRNTRGPARLDLRQVAYDEEVVKLRSRKQTDPYSGRVTFGIGVGHHHRFHHHYHHGFYGH